MNGTKLAVLSGVIALVVALGVSFFVPRRPVPPERPVGAIPGNSIDGPVFKVGGVSQISLVQAMRTSTSTICALTPRATSTLDSVLIEFTTASATGQVHLYKGTVDTATTAGGRLYTWDVDNEVGLLQFFATSTYQGGYGPIDLTWGPTSTPLVVEVQGFTLSQGRFTGVGRCGATWRSLQPSL